MAASGNIIPAGAEPNKWGESQATYLSISTTKPFYILQASFTTNLENINFGDFLKGTLSLTMSQNIYDRQDFFTAYNTFIDRSNKTDLETDLAWKRLHPLLPKSLTGFHILDVGCGSGWFARWAIDHGAARVLALDISNNMISKARNLNGENAEYASKIDYRIADLDAEPLPLPLPETGGYDLVFSSLTLHYLVHLKEVVAQIQTQLKPGGSFVMNVEHPIYTAPHKPRLIEDKEDGEKYWSFKNYYEEGERVVDWLAPGLRKQHRTVTEYLDLFLGLEFQLTGFKEWLPLPEEIEAGLVGEEDLIRPLFLMMSVKKPE